jgi:DNA-binding NarL/FixJ family response regulator
MRQDQRVHVLVAERHPAVRRALRAAIDGPFVYHEAATALDALSKTIELTPDVVILDAALPVFENLEFTTQLARLVNGVKIVIVGVYESTELARRFRDAGAHGYVLKTDVGALIVDAVRTVAAGGMFFHDHMMPIATVDDKSASGATVSLRRSLTAREREVLLKLVEGRSNKEVALALQISVNTVETHRARIMNKLELHSMGDLVRYAIRNLLIIP